MWQETGQKQTPVHILRHHVLQIATDGQGLHEVTSAVASCLSPDAQLGQCNLFVQHTSCSLLIQENADPSVQTDLESWMHRLAPEHDPAYTHTQEGPDDMPAHLRSAVTSVQLSIPIVDGQLALGTWQGIYLWEHRRRPHRRSLIVTLLY